MKLNEIRDNEGSTKNRMRVGRGIGSGKGKTARPRREGPEGPHRRRRSKASKAARCRSTGACRSAASTSRTPASSTRSISAASSRRSPPASSTRRADHGETLVAAGVVSKPRDGVKILGVGELKAKLTFEVAGASKSARRGDREGRRLGHDPGRRCAGVSRAPTLA